MLPVGSKYNLREYMMAKKVIRRREVEARIGLACSTIYAMMAEGKFPRPVRLDAAPLAGLKKI